MIIPNPKDLVTEKHVEAAKASEYGAVVFTEWGPVGINKDGKIGWYMKPMPRYTSK